MQTFNSAFDRLESQIHILITYQRLPITFRAHSPNPSSVPSPLPLSHPQLLILFQLLPFQLPRLFPTLGSH